MLASSGEIGEPCGVPASTCETTPPSNTPARSQLPQQLDHAPIRDAPLHLGDQRVVVDAVKGSCDLLPVSRTSRRRCSPTRPSRTPAGGADCDRASTGERFPRPAGRGAVAGWVRGREDGHGACHSGPAPVAGVRTAGAGSDASAWPPGTAAGLARWQQVAAARGVDRFRRGR